MSNQFRVKNGLISPVITVDAGTTASAPLKIPQGVSPTTPSNGDFWTTAAGLLYHINGATNIVATGAQITALDTALRTEITLLEAELRDVIAALPPPTAAGVTSVNATGGTTGLSFSGGPITSTGSLTLTGILSFSNGGTGATSRQAALNDLAGSAPAGFYLRGNGSNVIMSGIQAADVPVLNQNTTGTAGSAVTLQTARTISMTGDVSWTSGPFNGSANASGTSTLATVNSNVGTFGSASVVPVLTVNGKGQVTAVSTTPVSAGGTASVGDIVITNRVLSAPTWLRANGAVYLRSSYPALAAQMAAQQQNTFPDADTSSRWAPLTPTGLTGGNISALATSNGIIFVGTSNGGFAVSDNSGASWTTRDPGFAGVPITSIFSEQIGPTSFTIVTGGSFSNPRVSTSFDLGQTWTVVSPAQFNFSVPTAVAFGNGVFIAVGSAGGIFTSSNAVNWTQRAQSLFPSHNLNAIVFRPSWAVFYICGAGGSAATSSDGVSWAQVFPNLGNTVLTSVGVVTDVVGVDYVVIGSGGGGLSYSTNTVQWVSLPTLALSSVNGFANGQMVSMAVGGNGVVSISTNGLVWTSKIGIFGTANVSKVIFNVSNGTFVISSGNSLASTPVRNFNDFTSFAVPNITNSGALAYIRSIA